MADPDGPAPAAAAAAVDSRILDKIRGWWSFSQVIESTEATKTGDESSSPENKKKTSVFTLIDSADNATVYLGVVETRRSEVPLKQAKQSLARIPDEYIYPVLPPELQAHAVPSLPESSAAAFHLKRPKMFTYRSHVGTTFVADQFLHEARILEQLRHNPHPNIGVCEGYWTPPCKGGRMVGIVLRQYKKTLRDLIQPPEYECYDSDGNRLDPADVKGIEHVSVPASAPVTRYMEQLRAAVAHLHSMGLAHNDVNPRNIMLDDNDNIVLIDLGSSKPFGDPLDEFGTPPYNEGFGKVSDQRNDELGLSAVEKWLASRVADEE